MAGALTKRAFPLIVRFRAPDSLAVSFRGLIPGGPDGGLPADQNHVFAIYHAQDHHLTGGRALHDLAAVVDDHAMGISDVLRGREHLSSTCRQMLLCHALGYPVPRVTRLAPILRQGRSSTAGPYEHLSVAQYRRWGYLPEALLAYLATPGWTLADRAEEVSLEQLIEQFDLTLAASVPLVLSPERLQSLNRQVLRSADPIRIQGLLRPRLEAAYGCWERSQGTGHNPWSWYRILVDATQAEANTVEEMVELSHFAFLDQVTDLTEEANQALADQSAAAVLRRCQQTLTDEDLATPSNANAYFRELRHQFRDEQGLRGKQVMFPLHAALTGSLRGPCLGVVGSLLGVTRCQKRLADALAALDPNGAATRAQPILVGAHAHPARQCICTSGRAG